MCRTAAYAQHSSRKQKEIERDSVDDGVEIMGGDEHDADAAVSANECVYNVYYYIQVIYNAHNVKQNG